MNGKPDFDGINRVMRKGGLTASSLPGAMRSMHMSPEGGEGGEAAIANPFERLEGKVEIESLNLDPLDDAQLHESLGRIRKFAQQLSKAGEDSVRAIAEDLKRLHEGFKASKEASDKALQTAKDLARFASGPPKATVDALRTIPLIYNPERFDFSRGKGISPAQFTLMNLRKEDARGFDDQILASIERHRYLNDVTAVSHVIMMSQGTDRVHQYLDRGGMKTLPTWKAYEESAKVFKAAMDTAEAGAGAEWVPTGVGLQLIPDIEPEFAVTQFIPTIPMPRSPYLYPVATLEGRARGGVEPIDDVETNNTPIFPQNVTTANITLTAKKLVSLTWYSREFDQDSIVAVATAIRNDLVYKIRASESSVWINGQLGAISGTASTYDTGYTFNNNTSTGDIDDRRLWNGLRYLINSCATSKSDATGVLTADLLTDVIGMCGKYARNKDSWIWLSSYLGEARMLVLKTNAGQSVLLTREVAGPNATFETGVAGYAFGSRFVVDNEFGQDLDANGIYSGAGNAKTAVLGFNRQRFRYGEVQMMELESSRENRFQVDQFGTKVTKRCVGVAVKTPNDTTNRCGGYIYNIG